MAVDGLTSDAIVALGLLALVVVAGVVLAVTAHLILPALARRRAARELARREREIREAWARVEVNLRRFSLAMAEAFVPVIEETTAAFAEFAEAMTRSGASRPRDPRVTVIPPRRR